MDIELKCQTVQTTERSGSVRLWDPLAGKQTEPGKPATQPNSVMMLNFTDPGQALQFRPGKIYLFNVSEKTE